MKYKQIVFDVDGTLLDTEYAVLHSLQDTVEEASGERPPLGSLAFALGITGADALRALGFADVPAALERWIGAMERYGDTVAPFAGIEAALAALAGLGYRLGIVTSKTGPELKRELDRFGLGRYFATVVCADDTAGHKPGPDPLLEYMARAGAGSGETLYVGDSRYDGECAKAAGVKFALAVWGCRGAGIAADYYPSTPEGLVSLMKDEDR